MHTKCQEVINFTKLLEFSLKKKKNDKENGRHKEIQQVVGKKKECHERKYVRTYFHLLTEIPAFTAPQNMQRKMNMNV